MPSRARGAGARIAGGGLAGLVVVLGAGLARAEPSRDVTAPPAEAGLAPSERAPVPNYWLRFGIGAGAAINSDHERILKLEGYDGGRYHVSFAAAHKLTDTVAVGGLLMYGWRSADTAEAGDDPTEEVIGVAPEYQEDLWVFGAQLPVSLDLGKKRTALVFIAPWLGAGTAKVSFYDQGKWQTGPAFGAGTGMFFPRMFMGFSLGLYFVPLPAPGGIEAGNDLGMLHFSVFAGADVG